MEKMSGKCCIHIGRWVCSTVLVMSMMACDDALDNKTPDVPSEKGVPVELSFGFANEEDGYTLSGSGNTRSENALQEGGFSAQLIPNANTRATADLKPDALYQLHVLQYKQDGTLIGSVQYTAVTSIGTKLTYTLQTANDCQLVIIARGQGNMYPGISGSLGDVQKLTMDKTIFENIPTSGATQDQINKMPYVLHLEHVNVTSDGKLQSIEGAHDARLLLKRLATKLTVNWNYNVAGYKLNQLLLQSIPLNFTVVDKPDDQDGTYPSLVSQFTTLVAPVTDADAANGSYSCWVPANVRGESAAATSDLQRTKANAPTGSAFFNFVAVNTTDGKKKLDYRVYVGSGASTDFNMHHNKDYVYQVDFNHVGIPTGDRRVTYIDPIPASESNDNLVPTANCFMVAPGGAFCFDPFAYQQDGKVIRNDILKGWADARSGIVSVKLIWQTKEFGDVGDPVMGIVNSTTDHTNVVDVSRVSDEITTNPATDMGQCLIYCKVAPNTAGGNGLIAAYDASGEILWSWHIWVTNYSPSAVGDETVLAINKQKQKYTARLDIDQLPMMDRYLGAQEGFTDVPSTELEKSKANGMHYQWGRKDPFAGSYTNDRVSSIAIKLNEPTIGLANFYNPDGFTFFPRKTEGHRVSVEVACKNPRITYVMKPYWCVDETASWGTGIVGELKTVYDPCPQGWRVPEGKNYFSLFEGAYGGTSSHVSHPINEKTFSIEAGGAVIYYDNSTLPE